MLMDTIKSILSKFKVNDTSDTVKEVINKNSTTINNLDIPAELETYKDWEEKMLEKLAANTLALTEYKHRIQKTLDLLQKQKENLIKSAEDVANSRETISTVYPQVDQPTTEFPWDSPVLITHLATLNSSSETPYYSVEELIGNVFLTDTLNSVNVSEVTPNIPSTENNTQQKIANIKHIEASATVDTIDIDLFLEDLSTAIGRTASFYVSTTPSLIHNTDAPQDGEKEVINDILYMLLNTEVSPILNYSFGNNSKENVNNILPYFIRYYNCLQQLQTATIKLLHKIDSQAN